jgi:hypothetical protein
MTAKDQLVRLLGIQELAITTRAAQEVVDGAPRRIEEIETRFRERNAEYVAVKERRDALDQDQATRSAALTELEAARKKFMEDLMQVRTQREYAAMLKEIDQVKAKIGDHEEAILKAMDELEKLNADLEARAAHIGEERKLVDRERAEVEARVAEAQARIAECERERARLEAEIPRSLVETARRLEDGRQGQFMARAQDATCQACYVRMRPQVFQEVRAASRIHFCGSCKRMLYYPPALQAPAETRPGHSQEAAGLGVANGETV